RGSGDSELPGLAFQLLPIAVCGVRPIPGMVGHESHPVRSIAVVETRDAVRPERRGELNVYKRVSVRRTRERDLEDAPLLRLAQGGHGAEQARAEEFHRAAPSNIFANSLGWDHWALWMVSTGQPRDLARRIAHLSITPRLFPRRTCL